MAKKAVRGELSQAIRDYLAANPEAGVNAIVAGLAEKGVAVKPSLVGAVKYKMPANGKPSKGPKAVKGVKRRNKKRAQQPATGSRSQAIRDYLAANPGAPTAAVIAGLAEQGITVSTGLVSVIKYKKLGKGTKAARGVKVRGRKRAAASGNGKVSVEGLLQAKKLIDAVGGIDEARAAIETLERLR